MSHPSVSTLRLAFGVMLAALLMAACSTVDCPLNNTVYAQYVLRGPVTTLPDTLTITTRRVTDGLDTVLINQQVNTDSFSLPMSYGQNEDILYFRTNHLRDTVWVKKTNEPHFESTDCGLNYFHTITGVRFTRHALDSIVINHQQVNYDASQKHFLVYFKEYRL
ncbi:MAG: DUF6452 family protein [Prevotella sp.]|nr:DUF6452 family protein [Prevotella sp.]